MYTRAKRVVVLTILCEFATTDQSRCGAEIPVVASPCMRNSSECVTTRVYSFDTSNCGAQHHAPQYVLLFVTWIPDNDRSFSASAELVTVASRLR
jgi:hypothetical protein